MAERLYERFLKMEDEIEQLLEMRGKLHKNDSPEARQAFNEETVCFSREMLILSMACERIGLTGTGEEDSVPPHNEQQVHRYPLIIHESAEQLIKRYTIFYAFWSREELRDQIARNTDFASNIAQGWSLLKGLYRSSDLNSDSDEPCNPLLEQVLAEQECSFTTDPTSFVAMDYSNGEYDFFEFREDVALQIEHLHTRFDEWMSKQEEIQPFRINHHHDGWYTIQGHQDFVDWINTQIYHAPVGRRSKGTPSRQPIARLSF